MATKKTTTTKRKGSAAGADRLKKIITEAKRIRKESPNKKWTTCVKEAGKKLKGKL